MGSISYSVSGGVAPITVTLNPGGNVNVHTSTPDTGIFENLPIEQEYILEVVDSSTPPCMAQNSIILTANEQIPENVESNDAFLYDSNSISIIIPSTTPIGDVIFLFTATTSNSDFNSPTGWTLLKKVAQSGNYNSWGVWYKIVEAGDPGSTITITFNFAGSLYLSCCSFPCNDSHPRIYPINDLDYIRAKGVTSLNANIQDGMKDATLVSFVNVYDTNLLNGNGNLFGTNGWLNIEGHNLGNNWFLYSKTRIQSINGETDNYDITLSVPADAQILIVQILPSDNNVLLNHYYNYYAIEDPRGMIKSGYRLPTKSDIDELRSYIASQGWNYDGSTDLGVYYGPGNPDNKQAKAVSHSRYWIFNTVEGSPGNTDYKDKRNISGLSLLPTGFRIATTAEDILLQYGWYWTSDILDEDEMCMLSINSNDGKIYYYDGLDPDYNGEGWAHKGHGVAIILIKDDPESWVEGDTYIGNDGTIYPTVKIGTQVWVSRCLRETKYNNNDDIKYVDELDNVNWYDSGAPEGAYGINNHYNYYGL